ncbi:MAG: ribonuclease HII [Deltaproteobacteria bacterium]|nr:MAG: ribonuclease HII [Deltaproteobacteria bacterium]
MRAQIALGITPALEGRWLRILRYDARSGARDLVSVLERRRADRRREMRRLGRLFALRRTLFAAGARVVAGVDEVGVGPLAGPLVAAAVVLPARVYLPGLDDSKQLRAEQREALDGAIRAQAIAVSVAELSSSEVDRLNTRGASLEAMRRAVLGLADTPDHVLVDAHTIPAIAFAQTAIVDGDARDGSIAAASIVAKVYRDARMRELDARHPGYGFARHKGYATRDHVAALGRLGPCPEHRRSFTPVSQLGLFA